MSKVLLVLNDPPYGTERSYNGLRLAGSLAEQPGGADGVDPMGRPCHDVLSGDVTGGPGSSS